VYSSLYLLIIKKYGLKMDIEQVVYPHLILLLGCGAITQFVFKTYDSLWRYAESKEYLMLLLGGITGYVLFFIMDYGFFYNEGFQFLSIAAYAIALLGMLLMRLCYRLYRKRTKFKNGKDKIPLVIIGAGEAGVKLQQEIATHPSSGYQIICFIDDSTEKIGKRIQNIEIKGPIQDLEKLLKNTAVNEIILAIPSISVEKRKEIIDHCSSLKCHVRVLPDTWTVLHNNKEQTLWRNIREVNMEELLGREEVSFENKEVEQFIRNKVVLVTGGGGSIGSELCRQIANVSPKQLIIIDIYENNAYEIQQELYRTFGNKLDLKIEIASVRDKEKIFQLFHRYQPNIVFHAAAHKHVPLMEDCPEEAIKNNILGTNHVLQASDCCGVEKFVLISSDKAVNPTNIMGASKRFCELMIQSMNEVSKTEFVAVRFGNVLGSNGSVIPLFQKQILQGGPVTITDKRIVRYFMTISEAAQLVLQAGSMANNAEIYVLDMGPPVKIIDLAEKLIRLSGHIPYTEISINETGLRPGEKLYEELLMESKELIKTGNHKIYIEQQKAIDMEDISNKLDIIIKALDSQSSEVMKRVMKYAVPTYRDPEEYNQTVSPQ
jgi:FlaA1/EpsC-like NDP-sugar epimerase